MTHFRRGPSVEALVDYLAAAVAGSGSVDLAWARPDLHWFSHGQAMSQPSIEDIVDQLLGDADFHALKLGSWLHSPDGELIAAAVSQVLPYPYNVESRLLVGALRLAVDQQRNNSFDRALRDVLITAAAGLLVLLLPID